jgi:type I restriction-modification system DNA methylase subunit
MGRQKKKAADTPNGNGGSIKELLDGLWEAAVKLRGSIEPADYKRYVLPIIFLRFLSLRYDRRRAELEKLIADPKCDYHTTNRKHADAEQRRKTAPALQRRDLLGQRAGAEVTAEVLCHTRSNSYHAGGRIHFWFRALALGYHRSQLTCRIQ